MSRKTENHLTWFGVVAYYCGAVKDVKKQTLRFWHPLIILMTLCFFLITPAISLIKGIPIIDLWKAVWQEITRGLRER